MSSELMITALLSIFSLERSPRDRKIRICARRRIFQKGCSPPWKKKKNAFRGASRGPAKAAHGWMWKFLFYKAGWEGTAGGTTSLQSFPSRPICIINTKISLRSVITMKMAHKEPGKGRALCGASQAPGSRALGRIWEPSTESPKAQPAPSLARASPSTECSDNSS